MQIRQETKLQVQVVDQTTHPAKCHSFVGLDRQIGSSPPALELERERTKGRKREKLYICLDVTHTCSETSLRIVDVECIGRAKNTPVKPNRRNEKYIYIYIYIYIYGTMVATSCDLNAPRCATTVPQVRLHGSRGGVFVGHRPPRDPGDPLQN